MAKKVTAFFCSDCGYESSKWVGQCPGCHAWNTMVEAPIERKSPQKISSASPFARPVNLTEVETGEEERISTGMEEMDRVLGGGLVSGSLILVGGDPGIGKSTILLQVTKNISDGGRSVLYISGEESLKQIKLRANRIGSFTDRIRFLSETSLSAISDAIEREKPEVAVIDSIQTVYNEEGTGTPGSVSQIKDATNVFLNLAKGLNISIFIVGHVTKEGVVAGPRVLEHMVDTVLYFEGDRSASYRILRGVKNRFGSTNEIGVFEMRQEGLAEVKNPSEFMLSGKPEDASGSVVACLMEGTRPILLEVQALVCRSNFGMPRRTSLGVDYNRVNLLMAVLEKRAGIHLNDADAYVNIAGGIKATEPAIDLAIVLALASSYKDITIDSKTVIFGEVGLSGEVRSVSQAEMRVKEAAKLGFKRCVIPKTSLAAVSKVTGIEVIGVSNVREAIEWL